MRILVVGAGVAGLACAGTLQAGGVEVVVYESEPQVGGRLGSQQAPDGRWWDHGGSYVVDPPQGWPVREWTDTFDVAGGQRSTGPMRWVGVPSQRGICEHLSVGISVHLRSQVTAASERSVTLADGSQAHADGVVLAMPEPLAIQLGVPLEPSPWQSVLVLGARFDQVPDFDGMFVNDDPVLSFLAHDGSRAGDLAPVVVAHSTSQFAEDQSGDPQDTMVSAVCDVLGVGEPQWSHLKRWPQARPSQQHEEAFWLQGTLGVCGDAWGPGPRVRTAWDSGVALARALLDR